MAAKPDYSALVDFLYGLETNKQKNDGEDRKAIFVLSSGVFIGRYIKYDLNEGYVEIFLTEHLGTQHLRSEHFFITLSSIQAWGMQFL
jgi:hypothetical protein